MSNLSDKSHPKCKKNGHQSSRNEMLILGFCPTSNDQSIYAHVYLYILQLMNTQWAQCVSSESVVFYLAGVVYVFWIRYDTIAKNKYRIYETTKQKACNPTLH